MPVAVDIRKEEAIRSFWSNDPLNLACRRDIGEPFSLRDLIAYVAALPETQFQQLRRSR